MTDFTIVDGVTLMVVAMLTVFTILAALWGVLVIMGKLIDSGAENAVSAPAASKPQPVQKAPAPTPADGTITPEKAALIVSLIFNEDSENIKIKDN